MAMKQERVLMQEGYDIGIGVASATGSPMAVGAVGEVNTSAGRPWRVWVIHLSACRHE